MSSIPGLKKKLKSVRATGKLSKAMKTVSAAKFARLSALYKNFSLYAAQYRSLLEGETEAQQPDVFPAEPIESAKAVVVFGSNRGFCGGFNYEILQFLKETVIGRPEHLLVCGEEIGRLISDSGMKPERVFAFEDIPSFTECEALFDVLSELAGEDRDGPVLLIRPFFRNTMTQTPGAEWLHLNPSDGGAGREDCWCFPSEKAVFRLLTEKGIRTLLYGAVLETALGAQAATLMTMRSAYDTASEYSEKLEGEIHRQRQRDVTADVIETASERGNKGEEAND